MEEDTSQGRAKQGQADVGAWVEAFVAQRKMIEQGIRDRLPSDERAARLEDADSALPDVELPDSDALQRVADLLEDKLREMHGVVIGGGDAVHGVRLPPAFEPGPDLRTLLEKGRQDERLWLFKGGIQEVLYRFRDQGKAFVCEERDRLLTRLSSSVHQLEKVVATLEAHPVVAQAFGTDDGQRTAAALEAARAMASRYADMLTSLEEGVVSLLEKNYYRLESQFTASCALVCLQLYGNVSNAHLHDLLLLKSVHGLAHTAGQATAESTARDDREATRKRLERKRDAMLKRVMGRAKKESWPTWPILQLYHYDARFGRKPPRKSDPPQDEGLTGATAPTDRHGNPLLGGF